ncbi:MAG: GGDEF domain-containing protein [Desulfobulbaceae bacterium]|nr:GGDEF domain-containing protein [Desulfobulbaceae bacterium]
MFRQKILGVITISSIFIVLLLPVYSKYILFPAYDSFLIFRAEEILKGIGSKMIEKNNIVNPISLTTQLPIHFINDVKHIMETNGFWKVKIFTAEGMIVYSTDMADIGNHTKKNFFPEMFEDNKMRSHIDIKNINDGENLSQKNHYFIETYVPIKRENIPIGAFEIYYDITAIKQSLERLKNNEQKIMAPIILLLLSGGLFSSYLAYKNMSELKRSKEKFQKLSVTDELTGVLNRRGFLRQLDKQLMVINRGNRPALLIFIDLNDFKQINDMFGHDIGDEALRETAKILNNTFRGSDFIGRLDETVIGRFGGDEFAVLVTQLHGLGDSALIQERLEANIMQWNKTSETSYNLSLSVGIAKYSPESPCSADELICEADMLMYQQKQNRKNRRELFGDKQLVSNGLED